LSKAWYIRNVKVKLQLQLHASAALHPGRDPDVDGIEGWVGLEDLEKEKSLAPEWIRTLDLPARSIIIIATTLSRLP